MDIGALVRRILDMDDGLPPTVGGVPIVDVVGVLAGELPDEDEVYRRAVTEWRQVAEVAARRAAQRITFDRGPVCLVFAGDHHLGSRGTDYERCFAEAELVRDTPGMYAVLLGDLLDNFVIGQLRRIRDDARLTIGDEWALVRRYLRIVGSKLKAQVSGNHDHWAKLLIGVDYFREVVAAISPKCLYDSDDARFIVQVGEWEVPVRIRHHWQGHSIYNITHGIERAAKWDQDFLLGAGAHKHRGGVARSFIAGGEQGMAVMVGTYKRVDGYARRGGWPKVNASTAVAVLLDDDSRSMTGFDNLNLAAKYMRAVYERG